MTEADKHRFRHWEEERRRRVKTATRALGQCCLFSDALPAPVGRAATKCQLRVAGGG